MTLLMTAAGAWLGTGGRLYSVQTGSMAPAFRPGDAVLTRPVNLQTLKVGQIISYRNREQPRVIVSHRVIAIHGGSAPLVTKGDSNHLADASVSQAQLLGRVVAVAPNLGRWLQWLRSPLGLTVTLYLPAATWIGLEFRRAGQTLRQPSYTLYGHRRLQRR